MGPETQSGIWSYQWPQAGRPCSARPGGPLHKPGTYKHHSAPMRQGNAVWHDTNSPTGPVVQTLAVSTWLHLSSDASLNGV